MLQDGGAYRFDSYRVVPDSPQMQKDVLYMVASLNAHLDDPAAKEMVRIAGLNGVLPVEAAHFKEYPGRGMGALVTLPNEKNPRPTLLGTREFLTQCHLQFPALLETTLREWESEPETRISVIGWDGWVRGALKFKLQQPS
jgi:cation transport ATPase